MQVLEGTVAAEKLVHKTHVHDQEVAIAPIVGMAVIMPTFLNVMYGQEDWQGQHVTEAYGDHTGWNAPFIVDMLNKFFQITQSFSLIDLQEALQRVDKVHSPSLGTWSSRKVRKILSLNCVQYQLVLSF